jgi:hypothetical protein
MIWLDRSCVIETPQLVELAGNITWKALFTAEPTLMNISFTSLSQQLGVHCPRDPHVFEVFLDVDVALRTCVLEKEVVTWAMTSLHSAFLVLISVPEMSDHKWRRCTDELKKTLPSATFPMIAEIRQEGLLRGFLVKTVVQVGGFLLSGSQEAGPTQFPYLTNTYCRVVMGGLAL